MAYRIRTATPDDAPALLGIYAPYVTGTCTSFECDVPTLEEWRRRVEGVLEGYPYLVAEETRTPGDGQGARERAVGFAYAHEFGTRAAYRWSVETSVYVEQGRGRSGIGTALLDGLEAVLGRMGFANAEACITADNAASIAFHERRGYVKRGEFPSCAYKLGRWLGIVWMEKQLAPYAKRPDPPHAIAREDAEACLAAVNERLARTPL